MGRLSAAKKLAEKQASEKAARDAEKATAQAGEESSAAGADTTAEADAADAEKALEGTDVPTIDEVLAAGYSPDAARKIVDERRADAVTPEEMTEAGLLPDAPDKTVATPGDAGSHGMVDEVVPAEELYEAAAPDKPHVPTVDEIISDGYSPLKAQMIVDGMQAVADGPEMKESPFKGYRVTGMLARGFWAAGQKFAQAKPIDLRADELTDAQCAELEAASPKHIVVQKMGFYHE